jgi:hypothetical protein
MQNTSKEIAKSDELIKLVQEENFVGYIYKIDYDKAQIMTNDIWKKQVLGIPHNCFLLAAEFDPNHLQGDVLPNSEIILLRVVGSAKLPQDDDLIKAKIDKFQKQQEKYQNTSINSANRNHIVNDFDDITLNQIQFHGLECSILGTFYKKDDLLWLGSDLESFVSATRFNVYRPRKEALETIVNYVDPIRRKKAIEDMKELGIKGTIDSFPIGTVRYTSTDRLHRKKDEEQIRVFIQPTDFLSRRTAVFGMTRTGKSNMVKQTISVVKKVADEGRIKIGQIIYDINGEYANANRQDKGSLADVYPQDTVRYRMLKADGFEDLRNNFYEQINEGFSILIRELEDANRINNDYIRAFVNMSFDEPDREEKGEHNRWEVRVAAYKVLLYKAGFELPNKDYRIKLPVSQVVRDIVKQQANNYEFTEWKSGNKSVGVNLSLSEAYDWFIAAREANLSNPLPSSTKGKYWVDDTLKNLLNMIAQKSDNQNFISGFRILADGVKYHSPRRNKEVTGEIYEYLRNGKIVILDLSVGDPRIREKVSKEIAGKIFNLSMKQFVEGETPPNIVIYIEEAHNLIGKNMDLTETWPRIAKEGAKYGIALVYSTQEVSSVHPNILSNTENWFVTHLNNEREIKELAKFYDFADFSRSLLRAQDVGFARVKTLSSPFVIPVQIDKFDPKSQDSKNLKAIDLLKSWAEDGDEQEQKETWEFLNQALAEGNISYELVYTWYKNNKPRISANKRKTLERLLNQKYLPV